jgi:hypothetical protein
VFIYKDVMYASFAGAKTGHNPDRIENPYHTKKHGRHIGKCNASKGWLR